MEAFVRVVDHGGFTDAARKMGLSKSAVSKHVSALEARLAVRLLNRTTRRVSPTEVGLAYYDRARSVLAEAEEADSMVTAMQATPKGSLRVSAPVSFGVTQVAPAVARFLCAYTEVDVNMVLDDRFVELLAEGFDVGDPHRHPRRQLAQGEEARRDAERDRRLARLSRRGGDAAEHRRPERAPAAALFAARERQLLAAARPRGRGAADPGRRAADGEQRRGADAGGGGGARHRADPLVHARGRARGRAAGRGAAGPAAGDPRDLRRPSAGALPAAEAPGVHRLHGRAFQGHGSRTPGRGRDSGQGAQSGCVRARVSCG